jgi:hypothetical protein
MESQAIPTPGMAAASPPPPQPVIEPPIQEQPQKPQKPQQSSSGLYDKFGQTVAFSFGLAISIGLWAAGAYFTLNALEAVGVPNAMSLAWWLLPLGITGAEIWLMPRSSSRWQTVALFGFVLALDVASSWYGVLDKLGGRAMPLGPGFTVPAAGTAAHIFAVVAALALAFLPEKLGKYAGAELLKVWR